MSGLNSNYKKAHKPVGEEKSKFHQGYFYPKNPEKCVTQDNIYRSSWEAYFMDWLDRNDNVVRWGSEPIAIKYKNPVSNLKYCKEHSLNPKDPNNWKIANYMVDFWMEVKQNDGSVKKIFVEVKPYSQTQAPKPLNEGASLKEHRAYNRAAETYLVNCAKWKAALKYFRERGCEFIIVTEKTLGSLGLL